MQRAQAAFKEIARVIRIAQVGGRRVQRFEEEQRQRWVQPSFGLNRHERRKYLAKMRRAG
jgi:hypothetical protein